MAKFKLFHDCFEDVEGHDSEIISEQDGEKYGRPNWKFGIVVDGVMEVCPRCGGHGSHDRVDLDCSKLVDDMQQDGDYEGIEDYFNGAYSQTCEQCHGKNVVLAPYNVPEWAAKRMQDWDEQAAFDDAYAAQERAMGA